MEVESCTHHQGGHYQDYYHSDEDDRQGEGCAHDTTDLTKAYRGHVHHFSGENVSADQPSIPYVESMVPTVAKFSKGEWASALVPPGVTYFLEIRISKLVVSLTQIVHADQNLFERLPSMVDAAADGELERGDSCWRSAP